MKKYTDQEITEIITSTIENGNKVILGTDWHLIRYDKSAGTFYLKQDWEDIIRMQNKACGENDVFIFLGDLVDDDLPEFMPIYELLGCRAERQLTGKYKFMIRGNNDTFSDHSYKNLGFDEVVYGIRYKDIFFSHISVPLHFTEDTGCHTNVHGHMHRDNTDVDSIAYYHAYPDDNICICREDCHPVDLTDIIKHIRLWKYNNCNYVQGYEKPGMSRFLLNTCSEKMMELFNID